MDKNEIVVEEIFDEVVIYDLTRHKAHTLNSTAAQVWRWCDGLTLPETMAQRLVTQHALTQEQAESLVWLSLDRLKKAHLLKRGVQQPQRYTGVSRRQVLARVGVATLLPVVYSLMAPTAAMAFSCASGTCTCISVGCSGGAKVACLNTTFGTCSCQNNATQCANSGGVVCANC